MRYYYACIMDEHLARFRSLGNPDYRLYLTVMFKTYTEYREDFLAIHRQGQSWSCVMPLKRRLAFLR